MKKKFLSLILAICLFVPCIFAFTACGKEKEKTYAWGKTWSYQETVQSGWKSSGGDGNSIGSTKEDLLKREFNNLDLANMTIDGKKLDLSSVKSAELLKSEIEKAVKSFFQEQFKDFKVVFSTKEEKKVTINGTSYLAKENPNYGNNYYNILLDNEGEKICGNFIDECFDVNGKESLSLYFNSKLPSVSIGIPTKTIVSDLSMSKDIDEKGNVIGTKLYIDFEAYFSLEN